ncbi:MAG: creatininase family protein [Candidatus Bathyarchaeia archaeon]
MKTLLHEMTSQEFLEALSKDPIVIIPFGSIEQHGNHLPLGTDFLISYEVAKKASEILSSELSVIVLPPVWIGLSIEHLDFPGTLTFYEPESFISLVVDICKSLKKHGIRKIVFLNQHGGNKGILRGILQSIKAKTGSFVLFIQLERLIKDAIKRIIDSSIEIHAGEVETSIMMHLFSSLVDVEKAKKELPEKFMETLYIKLNSEKVDFSWLTKDLSSSGVIGDPLKASKEKGKELFEKAVNELCELLREFKRLKID